MNIELAVNAGTFLLVAVMVWILASDKMKRRKKTFSVQDAIRILVRTQSPFAVVMLKGTMGGDPILDRQTLVRYLGSRLLGKIPKDLKDRVVVDFSLVGGACTIVLPLNERLSGDASRLSSIVSEMNEVFGRPFDIGLCHHRFTLVGTGVALWDGDPKATPQNLVRQAHIAVSQSTDSKDGGVVFYTPQLGERWKQREWLRQALDADAGKSFPSLYIAVHAIVDPEGVVRAVEALLRGRFNGTEVSPFQLLHAAHELGIRAQVEKQAIVLAMRAKKALEGRGYMFPIHVNVPPEFLEEEGFATWFEDQCQRAGVAVSGVHPEILETGLVDVKDYIVVNNLRQLASVTHIFLDDIGSEHSGNSFENLLALIQLGIAVSPKLDRWAVAALRLADETGDEGRAAAVHMLCSLQGKVVLEFVSRPEDKGIVGRLIAINPEILEQGFAIHQPCSVNDFIIHQKSETQNPVGVPA